MPNDDIMYINHDLACEITKDETFIEQIKEKYKK